MNKAVNVAVVDGKTITQTVDLGAAKTGQPVRIKAVQGGKYILGEGEKGIAPENITIKRVGKNLHIALEGSDPDQPDLIIENFEGTGGQLVGIAEDGSYYPYISSDADQDRSAAFLYEGIESPQVLGAQSLAGFGNGLVAGSGIGWFWPALLGLGALGLLGGIYAATRDSDSKKDGVAAGSNPDKGAIGGANDDVGDKRGDILPGESTDDRTPTFTGIGRPGTSVEIVDNGKTIGTAIVGEDGKWTFTPAEPGLSDGSHNIVIIPVDKDGNKGEPSPGHEIIVDTVAPGRPLIEGVFDDVAPNEGLIASGGHTNDTTPTLSGTAEAGSIVRILDNGVEIGSVLADADGKWSFTPDPALAEGTHEFTLISEDAAGNVSVPSLPFPIIVDTTPPAKPGVGTGGIELVQDNVGPIQDDLESGDTTDDKTPTFSGGGATPGDTVVIIDNGVEIGTAIVGDDGKWTFTPEEPGLGDGPHEIVVVIRDPAGNESEPSDPPYIVIVDPTLPGKPGPGTGGIDDIWDNVDPQKGSVGNGDATDDTTPTLSGSGGKPGNTVIIIDDLTGTEIGTAIVDEDGKWEFTPNPPLAEGTYDLMVVIRNPNGNESEPSDPHTIIVDTTAPGKPGVGTGGIELVQDNVGPIQDDLESGDTTDDTTPTFSGGGATPGDTVVIIDNDVEIGTAIVGDDGKWTFTPEEPGLSDGSHEIVVVIRDPAGNESEPSDPHTVIVDTTAPIASATVTSMGKDSGTDSGDFVTNDGSAGRLIQGSLTGALAVGEKVQVSTDGGATWLDVLMNADGTWNFIDQNSHAADWTIQTRVVDAAGHVGAVTSQAVSLDNQAPDAPDTFAINGNIVTVTFDGSSLIAGDSILVVVGNERFERALTQEEIDAGSVDVLTAAGASTSNTSVSFIDQAGNSSHVLKTADVQSDFESAIPGRLPINSIMDFGGFTVRWDSGAADSVLFPRGIVAAGTVTGEGLVTPSVGLGFWGGNPEDARITLNNGETATEAKFRIGELTDTMRVRFYDDAGKVIHIVDVPPATAGNIIQDVSATMPDGLKFSYFELDTHPTQYFWLDDVVISGTGFRENAPTTAQAIEGTGAYHGGDTDDIFSLSDVANLNAADSIVSGGAGKDTLALTGTGQILDLSAITGKLESIEIIDITGTGNNTLNLSLGDVLEQGATSLFTADETVQMMIKGNVGDVVNLDDLMPDGTDPGDWAVAGTTTVAGVTYNVYQHSTLDAQLLVQDGVTTNLV